MILRFDLQEFCREEYKAKGTLPPDVFKRLTPGQFVGLFTRPAGRPPSPDPLTELIRHNDERGRRGLLPTLTSWLLNG